ncbi:hypothetical protein GLYMA_08G166400v4 [Glycine max]|uniref:Uncharacterized protein n=1 Tax=Glycine max TaxID=3847 RepID=A0A0R0IN50_SOYBN|nr:hypothetical protein GYH30_021468 [Glycine max]KRH43713.1 hypothetical protein GLYMA_08G166400v4 [Glycine max]
MTFFTTAPHGTSSGEVIPQHFKCKRKRDLRCPSSLHLSCSPITPMVQQGNTPTLNRNAVMEV